MLDDLARSRKRDATTRTTAEKLAHRKTLMRDGGSADLDLSIPLQYSSGGWHGFGRAQYNLQIDTMHWGLGLQPFYNGKPRALTSDEFIRASVQDGANHGSRLWTRGYYTSTAVVTCAKDTTRFKLLRISPELLALGRRSQRGYLPANYDAANGPELRANSSFYGYHFREDEIVQHPFWQRALQPDNEPFTDKNKKILAAYAKIAVERLQANYPHLRISPRSAISYLTLTLENPRGSNEDALCSLVFASHRGMTCALIDEKLTSKYCMPLVWLRG